MEKRKRHNWWYGTLITEKGYQTVSLLLHRALDGLPSGDTVSFCEKAVTFMMASFHQPAVCPMLIGRAPELALLHLLVDRAKSGQGHVALLSGEAGIGKSRLMAEVKTYAASHDFRLLQGSCFPTDATIPYAPLLDLLRSHGSSHALAPLSTEMVPIVETLLPDLDPVLVGEPPATTKLLLDPEQEKRRRFAHGMRNEMTRRSLMVF